MAEVLPGPAGAGATPAPSEVLSDPGLNERSLVYVRFDPDYFVTVPGIVKIVQISLGLLGLICSIISIHGSTPVRIYYSCASMIAVCYSGTFLGLYVFHVVEKYQHKVPWLKIELVFSAIWVIVYLVAANVAINQWGDGPLMAAGFIGQRTTVAYGVDVYLKWGGVTRGHLAQQERVEYQFPAVDAVNTPVVSSLRV